MINNKNFEIAASHGTSVAVTLFATMLNPEYRGPNFKWENLADMAAEQAKKSVGLSFSNQNAFKRYRNEIEHTASKWARYEADRLLRESNVMDWHKLSH